MDETAKVLFNTAVQSQVQYIHIGAVQIMVKALYREGIYTLITIGLLDNSIKKYIMVKALILVLLVL
jgi:hypothetical protein